MKGRVALDRQLGEWIKSLPPTSTLLMYLGQHVGALEQAGIPLRRTINEGNHRVWKYPLDPDGLWERALADPASYADYAIGFGGRSSMESGARPPPHRIGRNPHNWAIAGGDFSRANLASCTRQHSVIRQVNAASAGAARTVIKSGSSFPNRKLINELAAHYRQCSRMEL